VKPEVEIRDKIVKSSEILEEIGISLTAPEYIRVSIVDNGIGFAKKYSEKIFNIFQRLHGRNEYEGTGIGLSICRKIVTNHKGIIKARSREKVGSEFIVIFPIDN
jgi:signal transduction histidine kinase